MEPIMRLLIAAEEGRTLRKGERLSVDSELLAKELKVKWYVGEAIPDDLRPERSKVRELVRIKRDRYAMTYRDKEGQEYAIVGKIDHPPPLWGSQRPYHRQPPASYRQADRAGAGSASRLRTRIRHG